MNKKSLTSQGWKLLDKLNPILSKYEAVLAGGTALALQLGHRISVDLDFFTSKSFRVDALLSTISKAGLNYQILNEGENHITAVIDGVKFSLFHDECQFIDITEYKGTRIAGILDIAAMKVIAISQRGAKRDFVDLYSILLDTPFTKVADRLLKRYGSQRVSPVVIGKALMYFAEADSDPDPEYMDKKLKWDIVKRYFRDHARQFVLDLDHEIKRNRMT